MFEERLNCSLILQSLQQPATVVQLWATTKLLLYADTQIHFRSAIMEAKREMNSLEKCNCKGLWGYKNHLFLNINIFCFDSTSYSLGYRISSKPWLSVLFSIFESMQKYEIPASICLANEVLLVKPSHWFCCKCMGHVIKPTALFNCRKTVSALKTRTSF